MQRMFTTRLPTCETTIIWLACCEEQKSITSIRRAFVVKYTCLASPYKLKSQLHRWWITHAYGRRGCRFHRHLSVCFSARCLKNDAARITKLNIQMLRMSQKVKVQGHESRKRCRRGSPHSCECWLF